MFLISSCPQQAEITECNWRPLVTAEEIFLYIQLQRLEPGELEAEESRIFLMKIRVESFLSGPELASNIKGVYIVEGRRLDQQALHRILFLGTCVCIEVSILW
jgi:hypothetical protein